MIIDDELLDELLKRAAESPRKRMNLDLRGTENDSSQRMLNGLLPGTEVPVHRHRTTVETVVLLRGHVTEIFYNDKLEETRRVDIDITNGAHGVQVPKGAWHTIVAHEPSVIIEMKDGRYAPMESEDVVTIQSGLRNNEKSATEKMPYKPTNKIYLCLAHMSGKEQEYIKEAFDTNWVVPLGPNVNAFEMDLAGYLGVDDHVVALSSGTAAIHLALKTLGVGPGDEVIVQSFTFCASSNPVIYLGATPVFVDSERDTWNMAPELLERAVLDRKAKTGKYPKAIIPVALYGMPPKMNEIMAVADKYGIPVVEDAAEGLGSEYNGKKCGSFGKFGVMSFNGNKMITTSGGGALACPDMESKQKVMFYSTQAREPFPYYQHTEIGYNYRMSNISAGIGRGQMTILDDHVAHHRKVQSLYEQLLKDVDGVEVHSQPDNGLFNSNYWLCTITLDEKVTVKGQHDVKTGLTDCEPNANVEALRVWLDNHDIESRSAWKPMHKQPINQSYPSYVNGVSEDLFKRGMCLPAGPYVTDDDVKYIVEKIREAIG